MTAACPPMPLQPGWWERLLCGLLGHAWRVVAVSNAGNIEICRRCGLRQRVAPSTGRVS